MNKDWAEKFRETKQLLKKNTFPDGIKALSELRSSLFEEMLSWREALTKEEFSAQPFPNADGYHSKTVAYSLWHIFRIEDIVVNTLIKDEEQVFFAGNYQTRMNAPSVTTGNELEGEQIAGFSEKLDINVLYEYIAAVKKSTDEWLSKAEYADLKTKFGDADKERIKRLGVVSESEKASWLIDYWCGKDIQGLMLMPMSRHWIMHVEAADRIIAKLRKDCRPCACCGCLTVREKHDICPVCGWEDDRVQNADPSFAGGANGVNLETARKNYKKFGASEEKFLMKKRNGEKK